MFELSFGEILLFTIVALVVLGPERLPVLARFLGRSIAKIQNMIHNVKAELGAGMALHDLQQMQEQLRASAQSLKDDLQQQTQQWQHIQEHQYSPLPSDWDDDMSAERSWVATQQAVCKSASLAQQSRERRKNHRSYRILNHHAKKIGSRRQDKLSTHG